MYCKIKHKKTVSLPTGSRRGHDALANAADQIHRQHRIEIKDNLGAGWFAYIHPKAIPTNAVNKPRTQWIVASFERGLRSNQPPGRTACGSLVAYVAWLGPLPGQEAWLNSLQLPCLQRMASIAELEEQAMHDLELFGFLALIAVHHLEALLIPTSLAATALISAAPLKFEPVSY